MLMANSSFPRLLRIGYKQVEEFLIMLDGFYYLALLFVDFGEHVAKLGVKIPRNRINVFVKDG